MKGTVSRDFIVFLPILTVRWYFLVRYIFVKSIKIWPLISHIFRITNHRSLFFLKTSIYIQIVIRWASIHRLSICIIELPTTEDYSPALPSSSEHCLLQGERTGLLITPGELAMLSYRSITHRSSSFFRALPSSRCEKRSSKKKVKFRCKCSTFFTRNVPSVCLDPGL